MKVLTLHQPWAQLVALGVKTIETRSWSTSYRGPLIIHAGAKAARHWPSTAISDAVFRAGGSGRIKDLPLGAIVASCALVGVVPIVGPLGFEDRIPHALVVDEGSLALFHKDDYFAIGLDAQLPYGDFTPGRFAWLLEDIKPVEERCPACWGRGFFPLPVSKMSAAALDAGARYEGPDCPTCDGAGKCDPIPAKGHQRLWNWEPAA